MSLPSYDVTSWFPAVHTFFKRVDHLPGVGHSNDLDEKLAAEIDGLVPKKIDCGGFWVSISSLFWKLLTSGKSETILGRLNRWLSKPLTHSQPVIGHCNTSRKLSRSSSSIRIWSNIHSEWRCSISALVFKVKITWYIVIGGKSPLGQRSYRLYFDAEG